MNAPTLNPPFLADFITALQAFSDEGYIVRTVRAGGVQVGDYLVSYPCEFESAESMERVRSVRVERVVATGGEQSSGPTKSRQTIALEDNSEIKHYQDNPDVVVLRKQTPL